MPAAALIPVLLDVVGTALGVGSISAAVGAGVSGLISAEAAGTAILGAVTVGDVATGAIIGAGTGALSAAAQGQNVLKGAELGAISGGVGSIATGLAGPALQGALNADGTGGIGGAAAQGLTKATGSLAGGTAAGLVAGEPFGTAIKGALPKALAGALTTGLISEFGYEGNVIPPGSAGSLGQSLLTSALTPALSKSLGVGQSSLGGVTNYSSAPTTSPGPASFSGSQSGTPSSLGGSLATSPGFAYAPGSTVFGSSDKDSKAPSDVWNTSSLRELGSAVA